MKDLVAKFSKPVALVMDPFSDTLATAKASLSLKRHRRFICCDIDGDSLDVSLPGLLLVLVRQVLDDDSYINGD